MIKGIDVSENNGWVDWQAIANAGVKFAIVRSSYGKSGRDDMFLQNVNGAHAVGIKCGAYHYSYALNEAEARIEAENCRTAIEKAGVLLELPVFYDMEDADHYKSKNGFAFDPAQITRMCKIFLDNVHLNTGVYASYSWFDTYIDWRSLNCPIWNAQWGYSDDLKGYMWQYTDNLIIGGKNFDGNKMYLDSI